MSTTQDSFRIFRSIDELPASCGPSVVAIGNFDGVHLGHREILSAVVADARACGAIAIAVTFQPHPEHFLRPDRAPQLITPLEERLRLLAETGIDAVLVLKFDAALSRLTPREFVETILVAALKTSGIHEGENFRFGYRAAAGVSELAEFGREFSFTVTAHTAVHVRGLEVSSSAIRALVAAGDMRRARWMLGRPFTMLSTQARGRGVGSRLLVPTVNFAEYSGLTPAMGVYVTRLNVCGRAFEAVTNVGNRPTFEGVGFGIETHILNFEPVEMGEDTPLELEFLMRLRGEQKFSSTEALKTQIIKDVGRANRYFRRRKTVLNQSTE
ncbi:MAG TPA: bifunctional riboflavin kinase/FAD synthetase [Terracidiphilus sp.]|nr:bifunctional riboflavin kinase/FAD synthetase [Terracidiphilus sp.]